MKKKIVMIFLVVGILTFILIEGMIIISGQTNDSEEKAEVLIILGAGLRGEIPTLSLKNRLDKGIELFQRNPDLLIVVSGGQGEGETITEAEAMERYLLDYGVPKEQILKEDQSTSTYENFTFSKQVLLDQKINLEEPIFVITNDFHVFRSKMIAKRVGFEVITVPAKTPWIAVPSLYFREFFAVIKSVLLDR